MWNLNHPVSPPSCFLLPSPVSHPVFATLSSTFVFPSNHSPPAALIFLHILFQKQFLLDIFFIYISNAILRVPYTLPVLLPNPHTPTSWPWHSPVLGHMIFPRPRASPSIDGWLGPPLLPWHSSLLWGYANAWQIQKWWLLFISVLVSCPFMAMICIIYN